MFATQSIRLHPLIAFTPRNESIQWFSTTRIETVHFALKPLHDNVKIVIGRRYYTGNVERRSLWKPRIKILPKIYSIKRKWQIEAEKKFLQDRAAHPDGYIHGFNPIHLMPLHPHIRRIMHLGCASLKTVGEHRVRTLRQEVGSSIFDKSSLPVKSMFHMKEL